ncbi:hypothetical protein HYH03_004705 [Edaphochlamys debaryana]|uniref:Serine/threonine-protein phosphatase 2A activator n=1 Tax=Edaphochlamys debaryana TaxID=47281 RepID=A0A835Y8J7_9CHLO|nr:hypothetical protein HYH03_004705 [Edaphochlamys debaryana]|eukprot:KAG2497114.1 hypothetical protein HYH03_004705 [Edaphochlamys debaryana]
MKHAGVHVATGQEDDPGFPTSAPYHTADVLSPTAAPWATSVPHAHSPSHLSPAGSSGLAGGLSLGGLGRFPAPAGGGGFAGAGVDDGTFSVGGIAGGAGGAFPEPGAADAAVATADAAAAARAGQRRAPDPVINASPKMPDRTEPVQQYQPARKRITTAEELKRFLEGQSVKDFMAFILAINEAVKGKKSSDASYIPSPAVRATCDMLTKLGTMVDEVPPEQQSLRYGNPAFRTWHARLTERAPALLEAVLPEGVRQAVVELVPYLLDSFGNATRIDYGTGHETQFCALLYCLAKLGVFGEEDRQGLGLLIFKQYLELMRKVQTTYWLEPAGSHGVWGLDDYQFLPFIWGSAQLVAHPMIKPKSIHNADILEAYADAYLYLGCVKFVKKVKKGPLAETSPMLNDISCVPTWAKVNSGMIKMYQVEVLSKFPIMQHFMFGSLLAFE